MFLRKKIQHVLATWLIRPELSGKEGYHGILLSSHNYPGAA